MPDIRRQWCYALEAAADLSFEEYRNALPPGAPPERVAQMKQIQRLMDKFTAYAETIRSEAQALRTAELYWVSRDMVDVVLEAAKSLPEWTPQIAMPAATGLLCWAKSAGTVSSAVPTQEATEMDLNTPGVTARPLDESVATITDLPWDAIWWWTRPDGLLQLTPASRAEQNAAVLRMANTTSRYGAHTRSWSAPRCRAPTKPTPQKAPTRSSAPSAPPGCSWHKPTSPRPEPSAQLPSHAHGRNQPTTTPIWATRCLRGRPP